MALARRCVAPTTGRIPLRTMNRSVVPSLRVQFSVCRSYSSAPKVSAALIAELRKRSEAGIMECKEALAANNLDVGKAAEWLVQKGRSAKGKADRVSADGRMTVAVAGNHGVILEVNTETDFVARNEQFQELVDRMGAAVLAAKLMPQDGSDTIAIDQVLSLKLSDAEGSIENAISSLTYKTGEKLVLRRAFAINVPEGIVGGYNHHGRIASLVAISAKPYPNNPKQLEKFASNLAVNVVGFPPLFLYKEDVPVSYIESRKAAHEADEKAKKEKATKEKQATDKPEAEKPFKADKVLEEVVLMEQPIGKEQKAAHKMQNMLQKQFAMDVKVQRFLRHTLGEGVQKKTTDFAQEVEKQLNKVKV